VIQIKEEIMMR